MFEKLARQDKAVARRMTLARKNEKLARYWHVGKQTC